MAGPWERFAPQSAPQQPSGPWQRYANPVTQGGEQIGSYNPPTAGQPLQIEVQAQGPNYLETLGQAANATFYGLTQGATMGAYDELASVLGTPVMAASNLLNNRDSIEGWGDVIPFLGRSFQSARGLQDDALAQARQEAPIAYGAGDVAGALALGAGLSGVGATAFGNVARPTMAGMAARGAIEGGMTGSGTGFNTGDDVEDRLTGAATGGLMGALLGGVSGGVFGRLANRGQARQIETVDDLKQAASDLYDAGRSAGISATPQEFGALGSAIDGIARAENVILPNGRVNPAYSALNGILDVVDAYRGRNVSIGELQTIRGNIRDVVANPEPGVQRIAMDMLDEFNDFAYRLYPELAEADDLWWRAKTGELIERMRDLAVSRSGQYTQSGMENALRAEARAIERQIIRGRIKGLPTDLQHQISRLAQGDDLQNFARWASRFGARNPITASTGILAGISTGSIYPTLGIWGAAQGAGAVSRALAEEKYNLARALALTGGNIPSWQFGRGAGATVQGAGNVAAALAAGDE